MERRNLLKVTTAVALPLSSGCLGGHQVGNTGNNTESPDPTRSEPPDPSGVLLNNKTDGNVEIVVKIYRGDTEEKLFERSYTLKPHTTGSEDEEHISLEELPEESNRYMFITNHGLETTTEFVPAEEQQLEVQIYSSEINTQVLS